MEVFKLISSKKSWESVLRKISQKEIIERCDRLQIGDQWRESQKDPVLFFREYLSEFPDCFLRILSVQEYKMLLSVWESSSEITVDRYIRMYLKTLNLYGLLECDKDTVYVIEEAKQSLYFALKGRSAIGKALKFQELTYAVKGIMYQCGILGILPLFGMIKESVDISFEEFRKILIQRQELSSFLGIFRNTQNQKEYAYSVEVMDRDNILQMWKGTEWGNFEPIDYDAAVELGKRNGLGQWKGTMELMEFCKHKFLKGNVMAAIIFVKTVLRYIQNGADPETVLIKMQVQMEDFSEKEKETVAGFIEDMYWNVPVYEYKGRSRLAHKKLENYGFSVLDGGKL